MKIISQYTLSGPSFEAGISRLWSRSVNHLTATFDNMYGPIKPFEAEARLRYI
jgi:hypothetical protein